MRPGTQDILTPWLSPSHTSWAGAPSGHQQFWCSLSPLASRSSWLSSPRPCAALISLPSLWDNCNAGIRRVIPMTWGSSRRWIMTLWKPWMRVVRGAVRDIRPREALCIKMGGNQFESLLKNYKRGKDEWKYLLCLVLWARENHGYVWNFYYNELVRFFVSPNLFDHPV